MSEHDTGAHPDPVPTTQELEDYYAWQQRCNDAQAETIAHYSQHPGHLPIVSLEPWKNPALSEDDRMTLWTGSQVIGMNQRKKVFSRAASAVVGSSERAAFFDDVKCDYLGDSVNPGHFREISPAHNHTPFAIDFNYSRPVMNSYTESGTILHMRETLDPEAKTLAQKFFIVAANLNTLEVQRLYIDSTRVKQSKVVSSHFDEVFTLDTTQTPTTPQFPVAADNPLQPYLQEMLENHARQRKAQLKKSARGFSKYKAANSTEFERLRSVSRLDQERHLLGMIAVSAGYQLGERGVVEGGVLPSSINQ